MDGETKGKTATSPLSVHEVLKRHSLNVICRAVACLGVHRLSHSHNPELLLHVTVQSEHAVSQNPSSQLARTTRNNS
jgi:hypothetical protein